MRGKGSRFILGVWGLRVCSLDVAFASATVRNRPATVCIRSREGYMAAPMAFIFRGSKRRVASFCVASVAFCDISTSFITCRKSFCMACAFSEDELHFSWQAQRVGDHHRHFAWQAQHFRRVELHVFCEPHCQGCVKW